MKIAERLQGSSDDADVVDLDEMYRLALARRDAGTANKLRRDSARSYALPLIAGVAVIIAHCVAILILVQGRGQVGLQATPEDVSRQTTVSFIEPARVPDAVILPEVRLASPTLDKTRITNVVFDDPDANLLAGIIGPASAPQLDPAVVVDPIRYALRAGLNTGEAITVILAVEVLVDGSAGQVIVVTGTGNSLIDRAAIDYARSLRWIPATINRRATVTRITFPVTLNLS
jgi:hypothetical protein